MGFNLFKNNLAHSQYIFELKKFTQPKSTHEVLYHIIDVCIYAQPIIFCIYLNLTMEIYIVHGIHLF